MPLNMQEKGAAMPIDTKRVVRFCLIALPLVASAPTAASRDLRLVDASAGQDTALVLTLVTQGLDVNATRADGVTALLWAAH